MFFNNLFYLLFLSSHTDKSPVILTVSRVQNKMQRSSSISVGTPTPTLAQRGGITAPLPVDVRPFYSQNLFMHLEHNYIKNIFFLSFFIAKYTTRGGIYTDINIAFDAGSREKEFRKFKIIK